MRKGEGEPGDEATMVLPMHAITRLSSLAILLRNPCMEIIPEVDTEILKRGGTLLE